MTKRQLKLGAVLTPTGGPGHPYSWLDPEIPGDASVDIDWYIRYARLAEQARFDLVFIVDSQFITPSSPPHYLNRLEPLTLLSALAVATEHIGLVGTLTTSFNQPFNVARRFGSLDLISKGRAGWNVVTSGDAGTAGNYSLDEHYDYATRYGRALEHVEVVKALWDSYEDDAFPRDKQARTFLDPSKLHTLDHRGDYFSVVGPLNLERSRQGQPVIFQAGDSEQGRDLGARIADGIFTHAPTFEAGVAFYTDIKTRAAAYGRDPEDIVVLPGASVTVGDTDADAREIERATQLADNDFGKSVEELGRPFGWHDFTQYDLDAPFPTSALQYAERSFYTQAKKITELAVERGLTLRQTVEALNAPKLSPFTGTAVTVADELQRWLDGRALDGINIHIGHPAQFQRFVDEVLPILRERGVVRADYEENTLRGNLGIPFAENRHTRASRDGIAPPPLPGALPASV
ncbi:LLM class flavin-dependent oxidoreductase [Rhodococcoides yunnanense]|uniref:LLM class flavin-dependent oxidoreductase n=1 Tax=Rhodococcoides yunnanense TaxID=278209 RepID=UPI000934E62B|nr:LLM class flavin-dependent oxidoreductase [Rhodococcus yunnanensis]